MLLVNLRNKLGRPPPPRKRANSQFQNGLQTILYIILETPR